MHHRRPYRLVNPLTGLRRTRTAAVSYRALAPGGAGRSRGISATRIIPQTPTDHYSLITDHSYVYCADNPVKLVDPNGEEGILMDLNTILGKTAQMMLNHTTF